MKTPNVFEIGSLFGHTIVNPGHLKHIERRTIFGTIRERSGFGRFIMWNLSTPEGTVRVRVDVANHGNVEEWLVGESVVVVGVWTGMLIIAETVKRVET